MNERCERMSERCKQISECMSEWLFWTIVKRQKESQQSFATQLGDLCLGASLCFLDGTTHLYKRSGPFVGPSVCPLLFLKDRNFLMVENSQKFSITRPIAIVACSQQSTDTHLNFVLNFMLANLLGSQLAWVSTCMGDNLLGCQLAWASTCLGVNLLAHQLACASTCLRVN